MIVIVLSMVLMWMLMRAVAMVRVFVPVVYVAFMRVRMMRVSTAGVVVVRVFVMVVTAICMRMAVSRVMVVVGPRRTPALREQEHPHP